MYEVYLLGTYLRSIWLLLEQGSSKSKVSISPSPLYSVVSNGFWNSIISSSSLLFFFDLHIIHWRLVKKRKWSWWQKRLSLLCSLSVSSIYYCLIVLAGYVPFNRISWFFKSIHLYHSSLVLITHTWWSEVQVFAYFYFFYFLVLFYRGLTRWASIVRSL